MSALPQPSSKTDAPTSCDATATTSKNDAGAPESGSDWYEVKRDFNRFMLGDFVKLVEIGPLPSGPLEPERVHHSPSCLCGICLTEAQHRLDWVKARSLDGI
jgi:hypothetical protein